MLSLLLGCITKGIFSIWCEKNKLVYNKTGCCKVSDYQLGPALKKNPYIYIYTHTIHRRNFTLDQSVEKYGIMWLSFFVADSFCSYSVWSGTSLLSELWMTIDILQCSKKKGWSILNYVWSHTNSNFSLWFSTTILDLLVSTSK